MDSGTRAVSVQGLGRSLGLMLVAALLASCVGSSGPDDERAQASMTPTVAATETSTPIPAPVVGQQELIAAAVAELDSSIAAGQGPEGAIAYDLMDTSVDDEGFVTLTICAWTGESVFDDVRDSLYRTTVSADGAVTATHVTSPIAVGECVNSELIESAFDFIDTYDNYWASVLGEPATFSTNDLSPVLLEDDLFGRAADVAQDLVSRNVYLEPSEDPGDIRGSLEADVLFRRFEFGEHGLLEIVACTPMNLEYGSYRDGILLDDLGREGAPGIQSISSYQLVADPGSPFDWRITGSEGLGWADCFETGDWLDAANKWRPEATSLKVLDR